MSANEKTLVVRSLIGHEEARRAKGGEGKSPVRSVEEYVALIDAAYARGERRPVEEIWSAGL